MTKQEDGMCLAHLAVEARTQRSEEDIQKLWEATDGTNKRIDGMKNWVIAGMSSLIIQVGLMILGIVFAYMKFKGA